MTQPPPQNHLLIQFEKITRELWEWIDRENKRLQEELQEEAKVSCRCGHKESEHKSLDSRPFGKWNCTYCQCKEFQCHIIDGSQEVACAHLTSGPKSEKS